MTINVQESLAHKPSWVIYVDNQTREEVEVELSLKPRHTCKYFPWVDHSEPISLQLECSRRDRTSSQVDVAYRADIYVHIRACFMSEEESGTINQPCCNDKGVGCVWNATHKLLTNLTETRNYLIYFYNSTTAENSVCKVCGTCFLFSTCIFNEVIFRGKALFGLRVN